MIAAYFGKGSDSREIFDGLHISKCNGFENHLNQHNVIYIPFNEIPKECRNYQQYIDRIQRRLFKDLQRIFPNAKMEEDTALWDALNDIYEYEEYAHNTESPLLSYNHESDLTAVVNLVYLSAWNDYEVNREDKGGKGYVDFIFKPSVKKGDDCIILELKVDGTPREAIQQIKDKGYALAFKPKLGAAPV